MKKFLNRSLVSQILLLFIIFNTVSIAMFSFYVIKQDQKMAERNIEESLREIVNEKAQLISLTMRQIADETENLALWTEEYLRESCEEELSQEYDFTAEGILYKKIDPHLYHDDFVLKNSSVFFPAHKEMTGQIAAMVNQTEKLDSQFKRIFDNIPYLTWAAIPMGNGFLRIYPYTEMNMFEPTHMQSDDPFYKTATIGNPSGETRWTKPYLDLMGSGWVMTCTHPIYIDGKLEGVACLDVNFNTVRKDFLADFRLGNTGFAYLLENSGEVVYHPLVEPKSNKRGDVFLTNILETDLDNNYKKALAEVLAGDSGITRYYSEQNNGEYNLIAYASIYGQPWKVAVEIHQDDFISKSPINTSKLLYFIWVSIVIFLCFAVFLYKKYSEPFLQLIDRARRISKGNFDTDQTPFYYTEISELSHALNYMSTNLKEYTGELIQKNNQIETIFNSIGGLLAIVDTDYHIKMVNEKGLLELGKTRDQLIGEKCHAVIGGSSAICNECKIKKVIENKKSENGTVAIGDNIFDVSYFPTLDDSGAVTEIIVYRQNITERVLLEKELSQAEKMASIGQLSSAIAHELKTPLTVIKGSAYLVKRYSRKYDNSKIQENLDIISATVGSAEKIIYNLLDFSRVSKGGDVDIDLEKLVKQILFISKKESSRINLKITLDFEPSPFIFRGKLEPMKIILINLLTNAMAALKCGGNLEICGRSVIEEENRGEVIITIKDNGCGIAEDIKDKIFNPFFTTAEEGEGTGLGLWVTRTIVEKLEGQLSIESRQFEGTTVTLALPFEGKPKE